MWYYVQNNQRIGPIDDAAIADLVGNGTIARQTLMWREGMAGWQEAQQTELKDKFSGTPPTLISNQGMTAYAPTFDEYTPQSTRNLWLWFAWLVGAGLPLCILIIGILPLIAGIVIGYILLYRFWSIIQDGKARTTPGKAVGFCFIPFFNIYWIYVAMVGLSEDMNRYCRERNISAPVISEGLAITYFVMTCISCIPYLGLLTLIPTIIIWIILMKQFTDVAARILESKPQTQALQTQPT